jgi:hypothetical protein
MRRVNDHAIFIRELVFTLFAAGDGTDLLNPCDANCIAQP